MSDLIITLAGCHQGQRKRGVEYGYTAFMGPLYRAIDPDRTQFVDFRDDRYYEDPIYGSFIMGNNIVKTFHSKKDHNREESTMLTLGGDHTISFGSICAAKQIYGNIKVIWIDAHPDINTPCSSSSGNCHGMPLAYVFGMSRHHKLMSIKGPIITRDELAYVGLRSVDPFEESLIERNNLINFPASDVNDKGIDDVLKRLDEQLFRDPEEGPVKVHVSLDIDAIDPKYTPATGTPAGDGLTPDDVKKIIDYANSRSMGGRCNLDITEVNPSLSDIKGVCKTFDVCEDIINHYLGDETDDEDESGDGADGESEQIDQ